MDATPVRWIAVLVLLLGLGVAPPALADPGPPHAVAAKAQPLITKKCQKQFRADWRKLNHDTWAHAFDYYEARRKAEQVIYDQLRWLLSDPEAQELIPGHEAAAAKVLAEVKPIVASQRDEYLKELDAFAKKYSRKCLSDEGTTVFKAGMRALRASFNDIYSAHEQLFRANLAVQTAQADLAGQCLQDADLEASTTEENWRRSYDEFAKLRR